MGCDGWIKDITKPIKIEIRCYRCGNVVDLDNPKAHERCLEPPDDYLPTGGLPVDIEIDDYYAR